ncbi:hypothetical protein ACFC00_10725 [Streptomyces adustus]|uniref:hypothetical protein n=1 Tax=Streptomyces adustus TaxID=1609272 RepID=UPI0035E024A0
MLLAAGGLALAAGVLSLVRLAPDSGVGGLGAAETEPSPDIGGDWSPTAAATAVPRVSPSSTSVTGGTDGTGPVATTVRVTPAPADSARASSSAPPSAAASATGRAGAPVSASEPGTQVTGAATPRPTAPRPAPATTAPSDRQTDRPDPSDQQGEQDELDTPGAPGLCVPVIGLCVDVPDLAAR